MNSSSRTPLSHHQHHHSTHRQYGMERGNMKSSSVALSQTMIYAMNGIGESTSSSSPSSSSSMASIGGQNSLQEGVVTSPELTPLFRFHRNATSSVVDRLLSNGTTTPGVSEGVTSQDVSSTSIVTDTNVISATSTITNSSSGYSPAELLSSFVVDRNTTETSIGTTLVPSISDNDILGSLDTSTFPVGSRLNGTHTAYTSDSITHESMTIISDNLENLVDSSSGSSASAVSGVNDKSSIFLDDDLSLPLLIGVSVAVFIIILVLVILVCHFCDLRNRCRRNSDNGSYCGRDHSSRSSLTSEHHHHMHRHHHSSSLYINNPNSLDLSLDPSVERSVQASSGNASLYNADYNYHLKKQRYDFEHRPTIATTTCESTGTATASTNTHFVMHQNSGGGGDCDGNGCGSITRSVSVPGQQHQSVYGSGSQLSKNIVNYYESQQQSNKLSSSAKVVQACPPTTSAPICGGAGVAVSAPTGAALGAVIDVNNPHEIVTGNNESGSRFVAHKNGTFLLNDLIPGDNNTNSATSTLAHSGCADLRFATWSTSSALRSSSRLSNSANNNNNNHHSTHTNYPHHPCGDSFSNSSTLARLNFSKTRRNRMRNDSAAAIALIRSGVFVANTNAAVANTNHSNNNGSDNDDALLGNTWDSTPEVVFGGCSAPIVKQFPKFSSTHSTGQPTISTLPPPPPAVPIIVASTSSTPTPSQSKSLTQSQPIKPQQQQLPLQQSQSTTTDDLSPVEEAIVVYNERTAL